MSITYIDVNRLNSIDYDSEDNYSWTYPLKKNIVFPQGTQLSIQNSLINQKGILGDSIEIEETITEEIHSNVYITEDTHIVPDQIPFAVKNTAEPFFFPFI